MKQEKEEKEEQNQESPGVAGVVSGDNMSDGKQEEEEEEKESIIREKINHICCVYVQDFYVATEALVLGSWICCSKAIDLQNIVPCRRLDNHMSLMEKVMKMQSTTGNRQNVW